MNRLMLFAEYRQLGGSGYIKENLNVILKRGIHLECWSIRNEMKCSQQYKFHSQTFKNNTFVIRKELINYI